MISGLDHLVLTVADLEATLRFYRHGLGMRHETFGAGRSALHFGDHKINLHVAGKEFEPKAQHPTPGSADLCFLTERPLTEVMDRLAAIGHPAFLGPVERAGATGPLVSIYARDPDGNLIEIARRG
jgi:catechol 2,3-dioxygenase-like lactoylglutathione lyase family enzyme